jgi:hypothetical protein
LERPAPLPRGRDVGGVGSRVSFWTWPAPVATCTRGRPARLVVPVPARPGWGPTWGGVAGAREPLVVHRGWADSNCASVLAAVGSHQGPSFPQVGLRRSITKDSDCASGSVLAAVPVPTEGAGLHQRPSFPQVGTPCPGDHFNECNLGEGGPKLINEDLLSSGRERGPLGSTLPVGRYY